TAYATLDQLKDYLDLPPSNIVDDELLTMALDNASAIIDTQTHRTYVSTADETHYHDPMECVVGPMLYLNGDLAALTSVTNGDGSVIPLTSIYTQPSYDTPYYAVTLKRLSNLHWDFSGEIGVLGRWAYSVAPPLPIVQVTLRLSAWIYRQRDNALAVDRTLIVGNTVLAPAALPADVMTLLQPYRRIAL